MSPKKRKRSALDSQKTRSHYDDLEAENENPYRKDPALYIQAYEADISRGPMAQAAAESLEAANVHNSQVKTALIRLGTTTPEVWVDRYDYLLC